MLKRHPKQARRGVILIVVLMLLTLFAIIGVSFVLYADSEASSARLDREAKALSRPDMDPTQALSLVLGQVLYGVDDATGIYSGLRGHDMARGAYGINNYFDPTSGVTYALGNSTPFSGNGRLVYSYPGPAYPPAPALAGQNDWALVNYTYFPSDNPPGGIAIRDPDRYGVRAGLLQAGLPDPRQTYVGASGAPYTYPDQNSFYLGVIRASDGAVLAQSFHRPWMGFGSLDPKNPNWYNPPAPAPPNPAMKYMVLRPRPAENPRFPPPEDAGGDVKNFLGGPGYWDPIQQKFCNNDSFWVDPGLPPMTGPDGKAFKMLTAILAVDLGGRVDVNAHGNVRGNTAHRSNQGWGPWEVSLAQVLNSNTTEWINLYNGRINPTTKATDVLGKYGYNANSPNNPIPAPPGQAGGGNWAHYYGPVDYDASRNNGLPSAKWTWNTNPPIPNAASTTPPAGYGDGSQQERTNHPLIYNVSQPYPTPSSLVTTANVPAANNPIPYFNLRFPASDMERLLRFSDTDGPSLASQLERLCPLNFNNSSDLTGSAKRRLLVTTDSGDRNFPGIAPYLNPTTGGTFAYPPPGGGVVPQGPSVPFPTALPTSPGGDFGNDWRGLVTSKSAQQAAAIALSRISLNRPLPQYPLYDTTAGSATQGSQTTSTYATRFDKNATTATLFQQAQLARQVLANDIYRTLVAVTGAPMPTANPTNPLGVPAPDPGDVKAMTTLRYLAQIAVNIVDFIDEDDIMTPFNFYGVDDGLAAGSIGQTISNPAVYSPTANVPAYWVFGTELPHVVLNEVLAERGPTTITGTLTTAPVKVWAELYNVFQTPPPLPAIPPPSNPLQQQDGYTVPLYIPADPGASSPQSPYPAYRITVATGVAATTTRDNVIGAPVQSAPIFPVNTLDTDFSTQPTLTAGGSMGPGLQNPVPGLAGNNKVANIPANSKLLVVPSGPVGAGFQDIFGAGSLIPDGTPVAQSTNLTISPVPVGATDPATTGGVAVLLQRLANPHLPPSPSYDPTNPTAFNPWITVDFIDKVPLRALGDTNYASRSKRQPYGALTKAFGATAPAGSPVTDTNSTVPTPTAPVHHTFGGDNNPRTTPADWLVHLDRQVISPMELLNVSSNKPHNLTQLFVSSDTGTVPPPRTSFTHTVPWFDPVEPNGVSLRLYRLFEFLDTNDRGSGNPRAGRHTGKININAIWDKEPFLALCDPQISNRFLQTVVLQNQAYGNMLTSRSPGNANNLAGLPGPVGVSQAYVDALNKLYGTATNPTPYQLNKPFRSLATGYIQGTDPGTGKILDPQNPDGRGINDTLLRASPASAFLRLFEDPSDVVPATATTAQTHPYQQYEMLTKIFNNVTVRSNVFAVWITVGFFDYNPSTGQLGAEIGRSEGRNVRHRMFAIVDRSNCIAFNTTTQNTNITVTPPTGTAGSSLFYPLQTVNLNTVGVPNDPNPLPYNTQVVNNSNTGLNWAIGSRTQSLVQPLVLVYEPGDPTNEEVVVAVPVPVLIPGPGPPKYHYQLQAPFRKSHSKGAQVVCFGNPGPWARYDPRQDAGLVLTALSNNSTVVLPGPVLHFSIIE
jgi:hypothetical protein